MEYLFKTDFFNAELTLLGGQAFRWERTGDDRYTGIAGNRVLEIKREADGIIFCKIKKDEAVFWLKYFDAETDYNGIAKRLSKNAVMRKACESGRGLRILKQEPFETLISFIISQNNNIPRIRGIIKNLCRLYGERIDGEKYAFPSARALADLKESDLAPLKMGYRARYAIDAARKTRSGEVNLSALYETPTASARRELLKITGVGEKVADCVLLFAYGKADSFPRDVWVKRALAEFFPDGLPGCITGYEGIAQQYLFEYIRKFKIGKSKV